MRGEFCNICESKFLLCVLFDRSTYFNVVEKKQEMFILVARKPLGTLEFLGDKNWSLPGDE